MSESASSNLPKDPPRRRTEGLVSFFERSLLEWASDESATIAAGDWRDGAVMELVGAARLLPARYDGCFEGVRELPIWFLVAGGCGNPFRSDGYFSVTLNRPYEGHRPRWVVIWPVAELYEKYRQHEWVCADNEFISAVAGIPAGAG